MNIFQNEVLMGSIEYTAKIFFQFYLIISKIPNWL